MNHSISTAVIIAAGMGTRLKHLGKSMPKGFLKFGDLPIVEESIQRLLLAAINRIIIVTGYQADYYEKLATDYPGLVVTVINAQYAETGSMFSLYQVRSHVRNDFLLLESDLIYEQQALTKVLAAESDTAVLVSGFTRAGDEVYVNGKDGLITGMSKDAAQLDNIVGELVGITKISSRFWTEMLRSAEASFETSLTIGYETDCMMAALEAQPLYYKLVEDLIWAEIDDEGHLARARDEVYPKIIKRDRSPSLS